MLLFEGEKTAFNWLPVLMRERCRLLMSPTTGEEMMFGGSETSASDQKEYGINTCTALGSRTHVRRHTFVLNVVFDLKKKAMSW